jgi:phosphatidylglycerophosphate synthase
VSGVRYTRAVAAPGSPDVGPARPARGAAPPVTGDPTAVSTAVLIATAPADRGGPAALLPWEDGTLLSRLLEQLASLGVRDVRVLTRPQWHPAVAAVASGASASPSLAADLREIATLAGRRGDGIVVLAGDIVTHREALAGLLKDPRIGTGVLNGGGWLARQFAFRARAKRGRVISAASPYHAVFKPTGSFLGVVKVTAADRPVLAEVAAQLSELAADPPADWAEELERKEAMWRFGLWKAAQRAEARTRGEDEEDDATDVPASIEEAEDADEADLVAPADAVLSDEDEAWLRARVAAAPQDVPSMLLVGLVRSGVHVGISHLRRLFWARPLSPAGIAWAQERIVNHDEDAVLLQSAVKGSDGFFTTFFVSPYSRYIARWCAHRGFTPNQVTTVSVLIGLVAAAAFATGERWGLIAGAILLQASFTTDCVDGQLARYTRTFSKLGAWLDSIFDRTKEYLAFAGLAIGASRMGDGDVWLLACATITLQTVRHSADFAFGSTRQQIIGATEQPPVAQVRDAAGAAAAARRAARAEAAAAPAEPTAPRGVGGGGRGPNQRKALPFRILRAWHRIDRLPGVRWMKKMIAFPIGERFAAISLTAALFTPRTTFVTLLIWGGIAAVYTLTGRTLRSIVR